MSIFRKLSHSIWHCQYHIVWVPKYRFRILIGSVKEAVQARIQAICGYAGCQVLELNVQRDHVHLVVMIPPKVAVSELMGRLKGQTSVAKQGTPGKKKTPTTVDNVFFFMMNPKQLREGRIFFEKM